MQRTSSQLSLRAKGKQLLGFYQVATRVASVYDVPMPESVEQLLSVFELLSINIGGIGLPMQCLSLGTYQQQLMTTMLLPVGVVYSDMCIVSHNLPLRLGDLMPETTPTCCSTSRRRCSLPRR